MDVTMVKVTPSDSNNNTESTSSHPIVFELTGRMAGGNHMQDKTTGDVQVPLEFFLNVFH